MIWLLGEAYI